MTMLVRLAPAVLPVAPEQTVVLPNYAEVNLSFFADTSNVCINISNYYFQKKDIGSLIALLKEIEGELK